MLGGLTAIATLELFTQNYFKYGPISFTMRQRMKFWVYPPGARLFRPLPHFVQRPTFFPKFWVWPGSDPGPVRVRSTFFVVKKYVDQTRTGPGSDPKFWKKNRIALSTFNTLAFLYNYRAPGGWYGIPMSHRIHKVLKNWFNLFNVQNHFFIRIVHWKRGSDPDRTRIRPGSDPKI